MNTNKTVLLGMSGGVDSAASALILRQQGYQVTGVTLRLHDNAGKDGKDAEAAAVTAACLGIRHMVMDARDHFEKEVVASFADAYARGITPNPCVTCNRTSKFPLLLEIADREGIGCIATGHYAFTERSGGRLRLRRGWDRKKDQSYVLYCMPQEWLARTVFPLGLHCKQTVRAIVAQAGLSPPDTEESQDICFVPDGDYAAFLKRYTGAQSSAGNFLDEQGNVLGRHQGLWHYTVGQRRGLGVNLGKPMFVKSIDAASGDIVLAGNDSLFTSGLTAGDLRWIDPPPTEPTKVMAKIRYSHRAQPATVYPPQDGALRVEFDQPQRAVTPGQAVVLYNEDYVMGGGTILK